MGLRPLSGTRLYPEDDSAAKIMPPLEDAVVNSGRRQGLRQQKSRSACVLSHKRRGSLRRAPSDGTLYLGSRCSRIGAHRGRRWSGCNPLLKFETSTLKGLGEGRRSTLAPPRSTPDDLGIQLSELRKTLSYIRHITGGASRDTELGVGAIGDLQREGPGLLPRSDVELRRFRSGLACETGSAR